LLPEETDGAVQERARADVSDESNEITRAGIKRANFG
jgi:hypothetical protein